MLKPVSSGESSPRRPRGGAAVAAGEEEDAAVPWPHPRGAAGS